MGTGRTWNAGTQGVLLMVAGNLGFALMAGLGKSAGDRFPLPELVFFRSLFAMLPLGFLVWRAGGVAVLKTRRPGAHLYRAAIWLIGLSCFFLAVQTLSVGEAITIGFAGPLFVTLLSYPMLKEKARAGQWIAVVVGFAGVLAIVHTGGGLFGLLTFGAVFALGNALFYALGSISIRQLGGTESGLALTFYTMLFGTLVSAMLLPFGWVTPAWSDLPLLIGLGLCGGLGQYLTAEGFRVLPASAGAPFFYTQAIWAFLYDYLFWNVLPGMFDLLGCALVIAAGFLAVGRNAMTRSPSTYSGRRALSAVLSVPSSR